VIEVVEIGKQLLMTRGSLTTFSIANDVAKYFAIIPAMFVAFHPQLQALNVMSLSTPQSAILSAIIFNALIIIALIPLALKGVRYRPIGAGRAITRAGGNGSRLRANSETSGKIIPLKGRADFR
jgi:potassium-transporting ATPase ATP-binding subunit